MIEQLAPAKINLALHVTGRRADGYHELDTIVGFATIADRLAFEAAPAGDIRLAATGPFAAELPSDPNDNLVVRAAHMLAEVAQAEGMKAGGATIGLKKNLPCASGLGGGSADAAATLNGLKRLWALPQSFDLARLGARLGADVPMCLRSAPLRAGGIGEIIQPIASARPLAAVLVNPRIALSTPEVFAALEQRRNPSIGELPENPFDPRYLATLRNDLQMPALGLAPVVGDVLDLIGRQAGCQLARMSGSGASCFGLFENTRAAIAAHRRIVDSAPGWWSAPTEIVGSAGHGNPQPPATHHEAQDEPN